VKPGLQITLFDPDGMSFRCDYGSADAARVFEIAARLISRQKRHFILSIEPCDEPPEPMSIDEWIAAGHTTD
jgi:hypothetical protein